MKKGEQKKGKKVAIGFFIVHSYLWTAMTLNGRLEGWIAWSDWDWRGREC